MNIHKTKLNAVIVSIPVSPHPSPSYPPAHTGDAALGG